MTCTQRLFISHKITPLGPALQFSWSHSYLSTEPGLPLQLCYCGTAHEQQLLPKQERSGYQLHCLRAPLTERTSRIVRQN